MERSTKFSPGINKQKHSLRDCADFGEKVENGIFHIGYK